MSSRDLYSTNGKFYTLNGAAPLYSYGISSAEKGISIAFSGSADSPERINLWYVRAPGDSTTDSLYFRTSWISEPARSMGARRRTRYA